MRMPHSKTAQLAAAIGLLAFYASAATAWILALMWAIEEIFG